MDDFRVVCRELASYAGGEVAAGPTGNARLGVKPQIVAANKVDALDDADRLAALQRWLAVRSIAMYPISAATGDGLGALRDAVWQRLAAAATAEETPAPGPGT